MKKKALPVFISLLLAFSLGSAPKYQAEEICMAINFDGSNRAVYFGNMNQILNITTRTYSLWFKLTSTVSDIYNSAFSWMNDDTGGRIYIRTAPRIAFYYKYTTGAGAWEATTNLSLNTWYHVVIIYNNNSASNDPQIYLNGNLQSINEIAAPNGSLPTETGYTIIGNVLTETQNYTYNFDGIIQDIRVYNRALSTNEIEILADSRALRTVVDGLVFWAPAWGANAESFDGIALTADHNIYDMISGISGIPMNGPIGVGNTIQPLK